MTNQDQGMGQVMGRVVTILDPGAQFARGFLIGNLVLVVCARRLVSYDLPAITNQVEREARQPRGQLVGKGIIHYQQHYATAFLGR
ncbi:MAG: hypothetical protein DRR06_18740 [Gammaproteobacteria bacterium]|nr:MAG: hypothetical protein DRR06_18740 [Gammaproteobacteria bacterium]